MIFPKDFIFGVADADLQVIGEDNTLKHENSEKTMWMEFARNSGKVYQGQTTGPGIDRYHLWKEDLEIMEKMGVKHYRTSISMSRTLLTDGRPNEKALKWYEEYFKAIKKAGISLYVTLYHWELPLYLAEKGGWENRLSADYLVKHAEVIVKHFGKYIDEYFILNEPWCSSILSYYLGIHAPGKTSLKSALQAAHNLLLAQGMVFRVIKQISPYARVSTVFNVSPDYAKTADRKDVLAAKYSDGSSNRWFFDPVFKGEYPMDMIELYGNNMPEIKKQDMKLINIGSELHSMGLNYYRGDIVNYDQKNLLKFNNQNTLSGGEVNGLDWPIFYPPLYPEGLYDILGQIYYSYKDYGLKRLYITENGMAGRDKWDGKSKIVNDPERITYYKEHLRQIHKAVCHGIPVEAFFAWTLMDNYEWAEGYRPESRFGLIYVDRATMKRIWKKSAHWYSQLIKSKELA